MRGSGLQQALLAEDKGEQIKNTQAENDGGTRWKVGVVRDEESTSAAQHGHARRQEQHGGDLAHPETRRSSRQHQQAHRHQGAQRMKTRDQVDDPQTQEAVVRQDIERKESGRKLFRGRLW